MPDKPKVAFYWCASCGGCEESVVDLAEDILGVLDAVEIVLWPVAMDFKKSDVLAMADGSIAAAFINGAVRSREQQEMAALLRRKSALVIAYGSCAHTGGIPGLANQFDPEQMLRYIYEESPTTVNPGRTRPVPEYGSNGSTVHLPPLHGTVRALDQVIDVDYYLPGCPPVPRLLKNALEAVLSQSLPLRGSVLAPDLALCDECPRKETKPSDLAFTQFRRPHETLIDPGTCVLAQGILCMGPATRSGCGAQCVNGNMPCSGCFGPTSRVRDQGAKMLSALSSAVVAKTEETIDATLAMIPDPVGTLYRYALPASALRRKLIKQANSSNP